jgi:transposase
MYTVDLYLRVRLACHVEGISERDVASRFGIARETVRKMLRHAEPPGYRRRVVLSRLRSGLSTHLCGLSFECQGAFAIQ